MTHVIDSQYTVTEVPEKERLLFTQKLFDQRMFIRGEIAVYDWMDRLCEQYRGGLWRFLQVSNGAFYMAPQIEGTLQMAWPLNHSDECMSADAAGIVATLFALNQITESYPMHGIIRRYHLLRDVAVQHDEMQTIMRLID